MSALQRLDEVLGVVRLCRGCGEEWPVDEEFFYFQHGRVVGRCRACWAERERDDRGRARFVTPLLEVAS